MKNYRIKCQIYPENLSKEMISFFRNSEPIKIEETSNYYNIEFEPVDKHAKNIDNFNCEFTTDLIENIEEFISYIECEELFKWNNISFYCGKVNSYEEE